MRFNAVCTSHFKADLCVTFGVWSASFLLQCDGGVFVFLQTAVAGRGENMDPSIQASYPSNPAVQGSMGSMYMGGYPHDGYPPHGYSTDYTSKMANMKAMGNGVLPVS